MSKSWRAGLHVLLIDDDRILCEVATDLLTSLGVGQISTAHDGIAGLAALRLESPDLIMCDLNMPGMDGVSFMRELGREGFSGGFALLSGEGQPLLRTAAELANAHALNFVGLIGKPLDPAAISAVLDRLHDASPTQEMAARPTIGAANLRQAITGDQLRVYYQPQIATADLRVLGVEALCRWLHPVHGLIPPDEFIGLAEEVGLIDALTDRVLRIALADYPAIAEAMGPQVAVSINLSVRSLRHTDLPERFAEAVDEAGIARDRIVFEVTESHLFEDLATSLEILSRLRLKGFQLSIDDFGTGYSSMRQLRIIPFNELKIDRSFAHAAAHDPAARAIMEASAELAQRLGLHLIAEGVEDRADWDTAAENGCAAVQGYYLCRPIALDALLVWFAGWDRTLPEQP